MGTLEVECVNHIFIWLHLDGLVDLVLPIRREHHLQCPQISHELGGGHLLERRNVYRVLVSNNLDGIILYMYMH